MPLFYNARSFDYFSPSLASGLTKGPDLAKLSLASYSPGVGGARDPHRGAACGARIRLGCGSNTSLATRLK